MRTPAIAALALLLLGAPLLPAADAPAPVSPALVVDGDVEHELHLTATAIAELPHVETTATDAHSGTKIAFRGVRISELLSRAGVPLGEKLRGKQLATYILATAADGYRVVFSLGELDPAMSGQEILLADSADGKPMDEKTGPLRLVVPNDKRPARWIRQLTGLKVVRVP